MHRRKRQIGTLHAKIPDQHHNRQHQFSARAMASAQVIAIEYLSVKDMARSMRRRAFRRSGSDAGLGEIRPQLTYEAQWRGRTLSLIDPF